MANLATNASDVLVIPGPENKIGNYGYSCTNPAMHRAYLGPISGCDSLNYTEQGKSDARKTSRPVSVLTGCRQTTGTSFVVTCCFVATTEWL